MLRTATLCLIAFGAVMVYSASSGTSLLSHGGDSSYYLKRYLVSAGLGLDRARASCSRTGSARCGGSRRVLLAVALGGLVLVLVPGFGIEANGARRWLGAGPLQIQPSEIAKLALVLYAAALIAAEPERTRSLDGVRPLLLVGRRDGGARRARAGPRHRDRDLPHARRDAGRRRREAAPPRDARRRARAARAGRSALLEPYRRERLTAFLDPWADAAGRGFQSVQAMIAIGSGGPFGVGLGESVQKLFYLPEAHTDMILAVIGEELGFARDLGRALPATG